jgi:hypothetical protein
MVETSNTHGEGNVHIQSEQGKLKGIYYLKMAVFWDVAP